MQKVILVVFLLFSTASAKVSTIEITTEFVIEKKMKIIDIRTEAEWEERGVIKDAYLITFFDERYGYDEVSFLKELNSIVKKSEEFAIICNIGSRTKLISNFLGKRLNYNVVNLDGGMNKLIEEGFIPEKYSIVNMSLKQ